ncbi:hypothetical protein FB451DRAFT_1186266 [Mycena latifolia]|nr:hypothetical protein FB451DRAFT_1186266 [Mycena latifolia]
MYYSVLQALEEVFPEAEARMAPFPGTPMSQTWEDFVIHAKRRLEFKMHFDSEDYVALNAYDNLVMRSFNCNQPFHAFFHNAVKSWKGRNSNAVLAAEKYTIAMNLANDWTGRCNATYATVFAPSTLVHPPISIEPLIDYSPFLGERGEEHSDLEAQQADHEARARRDGRIKLYLMHVTWPPDLVLPLRSADARIQDELIRISRGLQRDPATRRIMNEEQALRTSRCWINCPS